MKILKPIVLIFILHWFPLFAKSQNHTISGYVEDTATGERLYGVTVYEEHSKKGILTNSYGFYTLTLPSDSIKISYRYTGYETKQFSFFLNRDSTIQISLREVGVSMDTVLITSTFRDEMNSTQMGKITIQVGEAKKIPSLLGEVDLMKVIQLMPGVKTSTEGSAGLYIRGGGPDQNLILLDEAPVYNATHLFGFFSVFNPDAVSGMDLYKGGFPARYGGRLSSVVDVRMKEGNNKKIQGEGGIGIISSRFTLEGPIAKGRASFMISGRRTYLGTIAKIINNAKENDPNWTRLPGYYFYDLNTKINYRISPKDRIFLSGYFGKDFFSFFEAHYNFDFNWGNATTTARWNHLFSDKLFMNVTGLFSNYDFKVNHYIETYSLTLTSGIRDFSLKADLEYYPGTRHTIRFGGNVIHHLFRPGSINGGSADSILQVNIQRRFTGIESALYFSDDLKLGEKINVHLGLRASGFYTGDKWYAGPEPRLAFVYKANEKISLKGSYTHMYQYVHLVSGTSVSVPSDVWFPTTSTVPSQIADQVSAGVTWLPFKKGAYIFTFEAYYKWMSRQIELAEGASLFLNPALENDLVFGKGWSYGGEWLLRKQEGKHFTGWVGYTLSWTNRKFPDLNNGKPYPVKYDRRHDMSVVLSYKLKQRLTLNLNWVFGTGSAFTLPVGRYVIFGFDTPFWYDVLPHYTERNAFRLPDYHRMDLSLIWKFKEKKKWNSELVFAIYNVYSRRNPLFIYFDHVYDKQTNTVNFVAKQVTAFPIIPSITYNFHF